MTKQVSRQAISQRKIRARRVALGLCRDCGSDSGGHYRCAKCQSANYASTLKRARMHQLKKKAGSLPLLKDEQKAINKSDQLFKILDSLPALNDNDIQEFAACINGIQSLILQRPAVRNMSGGDDGQ